MASVDATPIPNQFLGRPSVAQAWLRPSWTSDWFAAPHLYVQSVRSGLSDNIGEALIVDHRGERVLQPGAEIFEPSPNIDPVNQFIRIDIPSETGAAVSWYGVVISEERRPLGGSAIGLAEDAILRAYDLSWLLTRVNIDSAVVHQDSFVHAAVTRINTPIPFRKNRSEVPAIGGLTNIYVFAEDNETKKHSWTALDIVEYLLEYFPVGDLSIDTLTVTRDILSQFNVVTNDVEGATLFDMFNLVISKRRGLAWKLNVNDATNQAVLEVMTACAEDVDLLGGKTLPANEHLRSVNLTFTWDTTVVHVRDTSRVYQQVQAIGEKRGGVFTARHGDFEKAWTAAAETAYKAGDPTAGALQPGRQKERNDTYRQNDALANVYRHFQFPLGWDGMVEGFLTADTPTCPKLDASGNPTNDQIEMWPAGLTLNSDLALLKFRDYSNDPANPVNNKPSDMSDEFQECFAVYLMPDSRYVRADKIAARAKDETMGDNGLQWSSHLRMNRSGPGFLLVPTDLPHVHALADWSGAQPSEVDAKLNFKESLVTLYMEFQDRVTEAYPETPIGHAYGIQSVLKVAMPKAHLDWMPNGTVLDVGDDGTLITSTQDGWVRDDRDKLKALARLAWQWYGRERHAITMTFGHITNKLRPGDFLTNIDDYPGDVNCLVTSVTWDFLGDSTIIHTEFAEIDPVGMLI